MGLLSVGTPMRWSEIPQYADLVRRKGIKEFLNIYRQLKDRDHDCLKWGDEVEFIIVKFDHENKKVYLLLKSEELLHHLQEPESKNEDIETAWRPEYGSYMIEGTPGKPYGDKIHEFTKVEANMKLRRHQIQELLGKDEYVISMTAFPLLGCKNFTWPSYKPTPQKGITKSLFWPDEAIFLGHPRYPSLARNTRERRKSKVCMNVPLFMDKNTPKFFIEDLEQYGDNNRESALVAKPNHIYLDAQGFGMGCSCLQMTFQAQNLAEARHLYDQLAPVTSIVLALSAASPIWRGLLSDIDCRWSVLSALNDDRTLEEVGKKPLKECKYRIPKSRYDSIDCYLSEKGSRYNDIKLVKNEEIYKMLIRNGVDKLLAQHIAHLFIRDPISLFKEKLDIDDEVETDHFENIQSTNWQTLRFKPPPFNSPIGWRVEFRPTELQITDFENAAFATFVVLLTRAILSFNLNFLIPISKVDENMQKAQKRDACRKEKFYFRKNIFASDPESDENSNLEDEYELMSINEIINGSSTFPGLIQLVRDYLNALLIVDLDTQLTINEYLKLISGRASGELMTCATWTRDFVQNHPKYNQDSVINDEIAYDLMWEIHLISTGQKACPKLLHTIETKHENFNTIEEEQEEELELAIPVPA